MLETAPRFRRVIKRWNGDKMRRGGNWPVPLVRQAGEGGKDFANI